jgi:hypothetical protein
MPFDPILSLASSCFSPQCLLPLCLFLSPTYPLPRVFVPSFTYRVSAQLVCVGGRGASVCPLTLRLRPKAPPLHNSSSVACGGASVCQLELALPPWGHWVYVRVETPSRGPGRTISFQLCVRLQGGNPFTCLSSLTCAVIYGWGDRAVFCDPQPTPAVSPPQPRYSILLRSQLFGASGHGATFIVCLCT